MLQAASMISSLASHLLKLKMGVPYLYLTASQRLQLWLRFQSWGGTLRILRPHGSLLLVNWDNRQGATGRHRDWGKEVTRMSDWMDLNKNKNIRKWRQTLRVSQKVVVLMVFWACLWRIGLFYSYWSFWIRQSQSDKTVSALRRSPTDSKDSLGRKWQIDELILMNLRMDKSSKKGS